MALSFQAQAISLGQLLSADRHFAIPSFQRNYCWTAREVSQLTADIWLGLVEARQLAGNYGGLLLGSIVVVDGQAEAAAANGAALVIDGKQRLTTLSILLAALRDRLGDAAPWIADLIWYPDTEAGVGESKARLLLDPEEDSYFELQVLRPGVSRDPYEPSGDAQGIRGIRECQQAIVEDLEGRSDADLMDLAVFLRDLVAVVLISAPDIDTGFRIFLTTNHRGKPLSSTDILKAELMAGVPEKSREQRLEQWRAAEKTLGSDFEDLPGYLRAVHGKAHGATIREVLEISQKHGSTERFLDTVMFPLAEKLHPILNAAHSGSPLSARINRSLRHLNWLRARDWVPPALAYVSRFPNENYGLADFLEAVERLAYGMQVIGFGSDRRIARYRTVIEMLGMERPLDLAANPLMLSDDEQRNFQLNAFNNLYQRNQSSCKLLLKRLSASYSGDESTSSLNDVTVEHVLPRNLPANSGWRLQIPNAEEREACSRLLGNLVLVTKQQNQVARNHDFEAKLRVFFPNGHTSPHAITNQIMRQRSWRAEDIRARDAELASRVSELWQLKARSAGRLEKLNARN